MATSLLGRCQGHARMLSGINVRATSMCVPQLGRQTFSTKNTRAETTANSNTTHFNFALSRSVPRSFSNAVVKFADNTSALDFEISKQQHDNYLDRLRKYVPTQCLPAIEEYPDCCFVEDTVVAVGKTAVITNPGHPSRKGEVDSIKEVLMGLGMNVVDMRESDKNAICDGGDVMYTGRHLFVGLSERTNEAAVEVLSKAFESKNGDCDFETIAVPFEGNALHLKSIVTHVDATTLLAPTGDLGSSILEAMKAAERGYECVRLPNMLACNVVVVNGGILAQDGGCAESRQLLESLAERKGLTIEFLDLSEKAKADGALTCCSVLLAI